MRDDRERILDIQEAIKNIEKYSKKGKKEFENNELIQTWVIHHLQIIGEAAGKLTENFRNNHQEIQWKDIIGMRNILVHGYFGIDTEIVWEAVDKNIPILKDKINTILEE